MVVRDAKPGGKDVRFRIRRNPGVLIGILGGIAFLLLAWSVRRREWEEAWGACELEAHRHGAQLQRQLERNLDQLRAIVSLYASSERVEEEEFLTFTSHGLQRNPTFRAAVCAVKEEAGRWRIRYRAGDLANELPAELLAGSAFAKALEQAEGMKDIAISEVLLRSGELPDRVLAAHAVESRDGNPQGVAAGLFDLDRLLEVARERGRFGCGLRLRDLSGPPGAEVTLGETGTDGEPGVALAVEVPGRLWRLEVVPEARAVAAGLSAAPWWVLVGGLLTTGIAIAFLASLSERARVAELARRRTREVQEAYGTLAQEAQERLWAVAANRQLRQIIDLFPNWIYVKDWNGRYLLVNEAAARALGKSAEELTRDTDLDEPVDVDETLREERELMERGLSSVVQADSFVDAEGNRRILRRIKVPCKFADAERALLCVAIDITEQRYAEDILRAQNRILGELGRGAPLHRILTELVNTAEEIIPHMRCTILRVDDRGQALCGGVAPSMPAFFNEAVEGFPIAADEGSCGAAAFLRRRFVVEDVRNHPNWERYLDLAERAHVRACWSEPVVGSDGALLGTLAMYYDRPRGPETFEERLIEALARLAALAIERSPVPAK